MRSPADDNPLETRQDFQRLITQLYDPLQAHFSPGNARLRPGETGAFYPDRDAELEGFSRLLWGIAPLAAGGYHFEDWERLRTGLVNGTTPDHDEHWGEADDYDQKHVEMAAIGVALALAPEHLWSPLNDDERDRVAIWLNQTNTAALHDCNWLFFRVLTNLGLKHVGADHDWQQVQADLDRLDSYALRDGWYSDGTDDTTGPRDHYTAWEMHVDGLLYSALTDDTAPYSQRFRERASRFASQYIDWFDDTGRALPYGRSLTYRFAQAAFWGALAFADTKPDAFSWGELRGVWARNIRWWLSQPIFTDSGVLSIGYRYPNLKMAEIYNSPSGPYWALKAALPLALPHTHPFWQADEQPLPERPATSVQRVPNSIVCRDDDMQHHYSLTAGQHDIAEGFSTDREKYNKFAYSTEFSVSVASRQLGLRGAGHDSTMVLSRDGHHFRMREDIEEKSVSEDAVYSRWTLFEDVTVDTWLIPALPWHVRVHRVNTPHELFSAEGGFALDRTGDHSATTYEHETDAGTACARYPAGCSAIKALSDSRNGAVVVQDSNVNLAQQRTIVPTLTTELPPGTTWLTAGVLATPEPTAELPLETHPQVAITEDGFTLTDAKGEQIYRDTL